MRQRDAVRKYYAENREDLRAKKKAWKTELGAEFKRRQLEYSKRSMARYPKRERARQLTANAIACGKLKRKPCVVCNSSPSDVHHLDYGNWAEVMWLCRKHHLAWHRLFIPEGL